jgi:pimeloyl-ACP methyl ester carboxylesterase
MERPGTGWSDSHRYASVSDWVADVAQVADALDVERLGVVGLSGGGHMLWRAAHWPRWSLG